MKGRSFTVALGAVVLMAGTAQAQQTPRAAGDSVSAERRIVLQRQVRERIAQIVKERLQLSDAQAVQLRETEQRFETRRRELMQREIRLRRDLRQQLKPGVAADQQRVASLLDQILAVHRARVGVIEDEQRDLARFLTPVQRAQYLGLQSQLRNRIEGMRQGRRNGHQGREQRPSRRHPSRP